LCSYTPVNKPGLNWIILVQVKAGEVLKSARSLVKFLLVFGIIGFSGLIYLGLLFSSRLAGRAQSLKNALLSLAEGREHNGLSDHAEDELGQAAGAVMALKDRIREAAGFATRLSEGNLDISMAALNDYDTLGNSLNKLRESMLQTKKEEEIRKVEDEVRNWTTQGIAMFNDILRQDNNDIKKLSFNILKNLIQYLSANQGGFFLLEEQPGEGQYLRLVSAYAFDRQKFLQKKIRVGEGLAGNCVQEKHTIHLKDIPEGYIEINSGLGGDSPRSLLLVPLKKEDQITGLIELASFNEFRKHEIEFIEKVAESIASTMVTVSLHEQTAILLEESKKRSEEVSQQEEELRQNLEELKATQEEMARIRKDEEQKEKERKVIEQRMMDELKEQQRLLSKEKSLLDALLNNVNENIYFKDLESRFIRFSGSMLKIFKLKKAEELTGKSDFDFFDEEHARPAYEDEQIIIRTGTPMVDKVEKEVYADGRVNYVNTSKMPLRDEQNNIIGTFGISKDVTRFVNMEQEIDKKNSQLQKLEEEIMRLKAALEKAGKDKTGA
jgi:PAS domain S-box-containing protein